MKGKMKPIEASFNKMLKELWENITPAPIPICSIVKLGATFTNNRKGRYYRVIKKEYERVYKKYNYQPKPKKGN